MLHIVHRICPYRTYLYSIAMQVDLVCPPVSHGCICTKMAVSTSRGGSQIWIGQGCAAGSSGPISMFWGKFSQNRYPCLGIFLKKGTHLVQFFQTDTLNFQMRPIHIVRDFCIKMGPILRDFFKKN